MDGADGLHCWDLDADAVCDAGEDKDGSGLCDAQDCLGPEGPQGPPGVISDDCEWVPALLQNGWVPMDLQVDAPSFCKDVTGEVHLRGVVAHGTDPGLFTLPAGYRPSGKKLFATVSGASIAVIEVYSYGPVVIWVPGGFTGAYVSLDGIAFLASF